MNNISYMTLAAVRNRAPEEFDRFIMNAVLAAGMEVGPAVVFSGLCHQSSAAVQHDAKRAA